MTAVSSDRIYYADLLTSLPALHIDGRLETLLAQPITVAGAYARKLVRPSPDTHRKPAT